MGKGTWVLSDHLLYYGQRVAWATFCRQARVGGVTVDPEPPDYKALGLAVSKLRRDRGWSVERLAHEAKVAHRSVTNVEGGHHVPRLETIWRLAHAFEMRAGDLVNVLYGVEGASLEGRD